MAAKLFIVTRRKTLQMVAASLSVVLGAGWEPGVVVSETDEDPAAASVEVDHRARFGQSCRLGGGEPCHVDVPGRLG